MENKINHFVFVLKKYLKNVFIPLVGLGSLIWFLARVISKPSRASYPCMQVAAPIASSFVLWLLGLVASVSAFSKMRLLFSQSSYPRGIIFLIIGVGAYLFAFTQLGSSSIAQKNMSFNQAEFESNNPIGEGKGIFPGRVVWVHNPDATNENCNPKEYPNSYFMPGNNDQEIIDTMISQAIQSLTGEPSDSVSWDAIFKYHNSTRNKGEVSYVPGEKIFLKINQTSTWGDGEFWDNWNKDDLTARNNSRYGMSESSPAFVMAVLRQLVNQAGVSEYDIYIGDPMKHTYQHLYDYWHNEFPNIHYLDNNGYTHMGREIAEKSLTAQIKYSDKGTVLNLNGEAIYDDFLYQIFEDAEYVLNLPQMKGHERGGVTMFAKNHFGSHTRNSASHLHDGLVVDNNWNSRAGYGLYRVQVDIMGHELLGRKNLVYLMDGLWATFYELYEPKKWQMEPFNNDWTSSIFASFDPVAIESVGYDFIRSEYTKERYKPEDMGEVDSVRINTIQLEGVDDYLVQAADPSTWPEGIIYDPEDDGTPLTSLGVHEHWNDPIDMEYSRNLGIGNGIELIKLGQISQTLNAPNNLKVELKENFDIKLSWEDNSNNEDGFIIEHRETIQNSEYTILDSVTSNEITYIDTTIRTTSSNIYRVLAYNDELRSEYSNEVFIDFLIGDVEDILLPNELRMSQNYPNPFNPTTSISYSISNVSSSYSSKVKLTVYDNLGRVIQTLVNEYQSHGSYTKDFDASELVSGIYYYTLSHNDISITKKMVLLK